VNRALGKPSRFGFHERDKLTGFAEWQFFGGVIRLPEAVTKRFDELHAFPHENARRAFLQADRNHRGPSGMRSKADSGRLHASLLASLQAQRYGRATMASSVHNILLTPAAGLP
jgi:hypothetical protein